MPTTHTIPQRIETHCAPCRHHQCVGRFCGPAGGTSWSEYVCAHPQAFDSMILPEGESPGIRAKQIEITARIAAAEGGRHIGRTERQPDWCPLKRTQKASE